MTARGEYHVDISKVFSRNTFNEKQAQRKSIKNKVLSDSFPRRKTWEKLELFSTHQVLTKLSENSLRLLLEEANTNTKFEEITVSLQGRRAYISSGLDHSNGSLNKSIFLSFFLSNFRESP